MRFDEETTPLQWGLAIALSLGAAAAISSIFGYSIGAATIGLAGVMVSTLGLLRAMARLVTSMSSEEVGLEFVSDDGRSARAWREEKKRSLRAIQELKLDYSLQKIGEKDYQAILSQYEARALAAMNALDAKSSLHPELALDLDRYGALADGASSAPAGDVAATPDEVSVLPDEGGDAQAGGEVSKTPDAAGEPSADLRTCGSCGAKISDAKARFCSSCGKELA